MLKASQQLGEITEIFDVVWAGTGWQYHLHLSEYLLCREQF